MGLLCRSCFQSHESFNRYPALFKRIVGAHKGWDLSQSIELCRELKAIGVDLIDCSSGAPRQNPCRPRLPGSLCSSYTKRGRHCNRRGGLYHPPGTGAAPEPAMQRNRSWTTAVELFSGKFLYIPIPMIIVWEQKKLQPDSSSVSKEWAPKGPDPIRGARSFDSSNGRSSFNPC